MSIQNLGNNFGKAVCRKQRRWNAGGFSLEIHLPGENAERVLWAILSSLSGLAQYEFAKMIASSPDGGMLFSDCIQEKPVRIAKSVQINLMNLGLPAFVPFSGKMWQFIQLKRPGN